MAKYRTEPLLPGETLPRTYAAGAPLSHRPTEHAARTPGGTQRLDANVWEAPAPRRSLTGKVLANKYELGTRLGVGGMGEVYRASHLALGIDVAVKIMHPHVAAVDEYARRFRREAYAASLLHHRNVVRILDFGDEGDLLYLVMELLRGQSTSAWLMSSPTPPPLAEVAEVLHQVLDAFEAAHAAGIVHRDLKPENVFLSIEADGKRVAKVLDFGLAHVDDHRDTGPTLTKTDMVSGTPEYMSPEQCRSLAVGASTDLYAIGCLVTEMLQLAPPFSGNAIEVMTQQMFVPPKPLMRPDGAEPIPPLLERLRLSLLAKAPEQRPHDVAEVRRLLHEALDPKANEQKLPERRATPQGRGELAPKVVTDAPPATGGAAMQLGVVRLAQREDGFSISCVTGLAAQGIMASSIANNEQSFRAILLDAGTDVDAAVNWLRNQPSKTPVIVCLSDVTTDRMSTLIAAGAKDIVPYPVTADVVARKVRRATRR